MLGISSSELGRSTTDSDPIDLRALVIFMRFQTVTFIPGPGNHRTCLRPRRVTGGPVRPVAQAARSLGPPHRRRPNRPSHHSQRSEKSSTLLTRRADRNPAAWAWIPAQGRIDGNTAAQSGAPHEIPHLEAGSFFTCSGVFFVFEANPAPSRTGGLPGGPGLRPARDLARATDARITQPVTSSATENQPVTSSAVRSLRCPTPARG